MESNKDEAVKAKKIAEQNLIEKDFAGAQKFALKAQNLFPGLDGLSQFLEVVNVYVAHEKKIDGEVDIYGVLSVEPSADDETIRKQYKRLALALHPDRNKSVGADGAFKIISKAWSLLYDKTKRTRDSSMQGNPHGFHNFSMIPASARNSTDANFQPARVAPQTSKVETFWTSCNTCQTHYEYLKIHRNQSMMCPKCHRPFREREVGFPVNIQASAYPLSSRQQQQVTNYPAANESSASGVKLPTAGQASHASQSAGGNLKRAHPEAAMSAPRITIKGSNKPRSSRELSTLEIRNMLMNKARMEIRKKPKEWSTTATSQTSSKKGKKKEKKKQIAPELTKNDLRRDKTAHDAVVESKILCVQKQWPVFSGSSDLEPEAKSMTVPDPDFHDFDEDRTEKSFKENQVWAAYDADDGMPRYYALIRNVISKNPFKLQFSWLNSKNNSELGPVNWVDSGFLKTSGDFRIGKQEISMTLNSFSLKVKWVKGAGGVIQIFPRKGDVWALYRHWSPKWNVRTPNDIVHSYDMVEVLGDYTEKEGVTVAPLVKVAGFKSVFRQHLDPKYLHIPREEMFRFSHQVPSYLLTGQEAPKAPTGCWELDPAALPLELLRVMTDAEIEAYGKGANTSDLKRTSGESKETDKSYVVGNNNVTKGEETSKDSISVVNKPILTYSRRKKDRSAYH